MFSPQGYMALPPREQRYRFLRYEGLEYPDTDIVDFEGRLARIHMREGLTARMVMERRDEASVNVFASRAWRRMFDIRGPLVYELILEFFSTIRFGQAILDLDTTGTLARQIPDKGDLRDYWMGILSAADFLSTTPSYTAIRDLIPRLCHRLIACSIAGRSQAPKKVTMMDLFYLRGTGVGSVNIPYLLARYLRLFVAGRKSGAHIFGGQFVSRLQISVELDDTWAWVAMGPERQHDAAADAHVDAEDAPIVDEGDQADPAPVQAPQQPSPPPPALVRIIP
ncbi:hypothetical protein Tco_0397672 [Tanacetum coccineum]